MRILGISAFYHDSAACLIANGKIIAAAQEERFTRIKHDAAFPRNAIKFCLQNGGVTLDQVDYIAFYDKPFLKFERLLETYLAFAPKGFHSFLLAMPIWLKEKLFQKLILCNELVKLGANKAVENRLLFAEHHESHAASAFFASPFTEAVVLTMDGVGEWTTTSTAIGRGNRLTLQREIQFPHSIGLLYSAFTFYLGFKVNSGEYKVMGLAPYGEAKYAKCILEHLVDLKPDGSFRLDMRYFDYCTGLKMVNRRFCRLFGTPPRKPDEPITQQHMDLAASIQEVTEEIILRLTRALAAAGDSKNLCMAGGVALNCVANGKVLRDGKFDNIWVQPAAGDAGGAIGAALAAYYSHLDRPRKPPIKDAMRGAFLGPHFPECDIEKQLQDAGARFKKLHDDRLFKTVAANLADGKAVGWFQGRMEFGPRALGARSILADPRNPHMQRILNQKVKFRESFRPFAPAILREDMPDWFDIERDSPYMLFTADVAKPKRWPPSKNSNAQGFGKLDVSRSEIPAVTHVDYSARIQSVDCATNPRFYRLLTQFKIITGCPVLVNTSFNVRGEPIVCSPADAFRCFMETNIDLLVIENYILYKEQQNSELKTNYRLTLDAD